MRSLVVPLPLTHSHLYSHPRARCSHSTLRPRGRLSPVCSSLTLFHLFILVARCALVRLIVAHTAHMLRRATDGVEPSLSSFAPPDSFPPVFLSPLPPLFFSVSDAHSLLLLPLLLHSPFSFFPPFHLSKRVSFIPSRTSLRSRSDTSLICVAE
jgi:hypothetical protein